MRYDTAVVGTEPARNVQRHPLLRRLAHWAQRAGHPDHDRQRLAHLQPGIRRCRSRLEFPAAISLGGDPAFAKPWSGEDGLANALAWHFGAMWLLVGSFLVYVVYGFASGHFQRDFLPVDRVTSPRFRGCGARQAQPCTRDYNAVQRVFYWGVMLAIVLMILSGLAIWKPVQFKGLTWLCGGYEAARVVHFFGMAAIVGFLVVHIALTILVPKTLLAMVTGEASEPRHEA